MYQLFQFSSEKSALEPGPSTFLLDAFLGSLCLRENVNLMYSVRDVVIESLVVICYRVYFCT